MTWTATCNIDMQRATRSAQCATRANLSLCAHRHRRHTAAFERRDGGGGGDLLIRKMHGTIAGGSDRQPPVAPGRRCAPSTSRLSRCRSSSRAHDNLKMLGGHIHRRLISARGQVGGEISIKLSRKMPAARRSHQPRNLERKQMGRLGSRASDQTHCDFSSPQLLPASQ